MVRLQHLRYSPQCLLFFTLTSFIISKPSYIPTRSIYNKMLKQSLILALLAVLVSSQVNNYQQRCIYYSQTDNACREIPDQVSDYINIIININDQDQMRRTIYGSTHCSDLPLRYAEKLYPGSWMYVTQYGIGTDIDFDQVPTRKYSFGLLSSLVQKVTVKNPATIYGKEHTCTIMGDGTVQHFGSGNGRPPAEIYMRCVFNTPDQIKEETGNLSK